MACTRSVEPRPFIKAMDKLRAVQGFNTVAASNIDGSVQSSIPLKAPGQ